MSGAETDPDAINIVARVLAEHVLSEASGGTAYEAYAVCSCGERNAISGGLREVAYRKGLRHVAAEVVAALRESRTDPLDHHLDRRSRYYAALHNAGVDAVMRVADDECAELRARLARAEGEPRTA